MASSTVQLYERIREAVPVQLPERPAVSEQLAALLRGLLDKNPSSRMTLAEVSCMVELRKHTCTERWHTLLSCDTVTWIHCCLAA
jgi:hypothetical protein